MKVHNIVSPIPISVQTIENDIVLFYKQCITQRATHKIATILDKLICDIMTFEPEINTFSFKTHHLNAVEKNTVKNGYLSKLFKMIYQIRDIKYGRGNRDMAYMMIHVWSKYHLTMAKIALKSFVTLSGFASSTEKPYGSWKDIKYFCNYVIKSRTKISTMNRDPMIEYAIELICSQIRDDYTCAIYGGNKSDISLCARWVPRETSRKFGWLFKLIALNYIPEYHLTATKRYQLDRAYNKTFREFSKIITGLNRILDTVQIKMCASEWSTINHTKLTCLTVTKNSAAFLNFSKRRGPIIKDDRIQCAKNFKTCMSHFHARFGTKQNNSIVEIHDIVQLAISNTTLSNTTISSTAISNTINSADSLELNEKWAKMMKNLSDDFTNMIPMIDMSASMCINSSIPLYTALGLGIAIAEKSYIGRRILTFTTNPMWICLDKCDTFGDCVSTLTNNYMTSGSAIQIYAALNQLLIRCIDEKIPEEIVSKTVLVIFTDMDLKIVDSSYHTEMIRSIYKNYAKFGYSKIPHILFWNQTNSSPPFFVKNAQSELFPKIEITADVTFINGINSHVLNAFMKNGMAAFTEMTEWKMLSAVLDTDRYCLVDDFFE